MKSLFLCHHHTDDQDVDILAAALKRRGVRPWVDHENGFPLGVPSEDEARRIIQQDCSGLLLYAHNRPGGECPALDCSEFIVKVEVPAALDARHEDPSYMLIAVVRGMEFGDLATRSVGAVAKDLSAFTGVGLRTDECLSEGAKAAGRRILHTVVARARARRRRGGTVRITFNTWERAPELPGSVLDLDWTQLWPGKTPEERGGMEQWVACLEDVKRALSEVYGPCVLRVGGRAHLSAALTLGRVFCRPSRFAVEMEQNGAFWDTRKTADCDQPLAMREESGSISSGELFVAITTTHWDPRAAVRALVRARGAEPRLYLWLSPGSVSRSEAVGDNAMCCAMARQVGQGVRSTLSKVALGSVHIFTAVPQALAMMIGREMNAVPAIQTYEYATGAYRRSFRLV